MKIKEVEQRLNVPRSKIRHFQEEGLFTPSQVEGNGYRDFTEDDIQRLEMVLILRAAGVSEKDLAVLQNEECTLEQILSKTETIVRKEVDERLGTLELIQQLRASGATYDAINRDAYWSEIQEKEAHGQHFMGHYELEDISDWAEPLVGMERVIVCPSCKVKNRVDLEDYLVDETCNPSTRDDDMGDEIIYSFDSENECTCRKCKALIHIKGWIREYPVGAFDSEDIVVDGQ